VILAHHLMNHKKNKKRMRKIIFLDIDGVIAIADDSGGLWGLSDKKQELLSDILAATDAEIVLTSCWRKSDLEETREYMTKKGFLFSKRIIGITIRAYHYIEKGVHLSIPRGVEIKQWIDTNIHSNNGKDWKRKEIGKEWNYIILDDDTDMLLEHKDHFIQCNSMEGLTEEQVAIAVTILNTVKE